MIECHTVKMAKHKVFSCNEKIISSGAAKAPGKSRPCEGKRNALCSSSCFCCRFVQSSVGDNKQSVCRGRIETRIRPREGIVEDYRLREASVISKFPFRRFVCIAKQVGSSFT